MMAFFHLLNEVSDEKYETKNSVSIGHPFFILLLSTKGLKGRQDNEKKMQSLSCYTVLDIIDTRHLGHRKR